MLNWDRGPAIRKAYSHFLCVRSSMPIIGYKSMSKLPVSVPRCVRCLVKDLVLKLSPKSDFAGM